MVKCVEDSRPSEDNAAQPNMVTPHAPAVTTNGFHNSGAEQTYGFRLQDDSASVGDRAERDSATSASVYSFYKQRIDSMFDETRSQLSGRTNHRHVPDNVIYHRLETEEEQRQRRINNSVQARIEKMFVEMAKTGDASIMRNLAQAKAIACNRFPVDYLGSVPLYDKVTSLQGLQDPLGDLYFAYCRLKEQQNTSGGNVVSTSGTLEISGSGLKVHHIGGADQTELEQLNPFPTIAVWAAVKFVSRVRSGTKDCLEYAFLPLIADPEAIDKGSLFRPLSPADHRTVSNVETSTPDIDPTYNHHSPLFAVVMRKLGVSRQLECHGFVCTCSEDAIVIAANLYQALMAFMQTRNRRQKQSTENGKGPKNKNGLSYMSLAGSSAGDFHETRSVVSVREHQPLGPRKASNLDVAPPAVLDTATEPPAPPSQEVAQLVLPKRAPSFKVLPPVPVRPPRKKGKSSISSASEEGDATTNKATTPDGRTSPKEQQVARENGAETPWRTRHNRSESEPCTGTVVEQAPLGVRRTVSDLHGYNSILPFAECSEGGDILTKVAIPRSKSFLNAGGPLTRYGRRQSMGPGFGSCNIGGGNGSPLGFKELFAEFRVQEGLTSMDDILNAIIDAEGMSFNDLKPIYKEFLLKLAVTLTKDELYQRSKSIMRRQRKKNRRKSGCVNRNKSFSANGGGGIKRVFRRSVNKLKPSSKPRPQSFEFTSVLFPSTAPVRGSKKIRNAFSFESSTTSTSSYSARNFHLQRQSSVKVGISRALRLPRRLSSKKKRTTSLRDGPARKRSQAHSVSEDSDFFSMARITGGKEGTGNGAGGSNRSCDVPAPLAQNRSSSGYFSCSECSYDSESCTCTSADKCYCSLGESKSRNQTSAPAAVAHDATLSSCGCDTDSCLESEKCYCSLKERSHHHHKHPTKPKRAPKTPPNYSVFDQLKRRGFAASESSLSRAASPTTAWHHNERRLGERQDATRSHSLEILETSSISAARKGQYTRRTRSDESAAGGGKVERRMDVYDSVASRKLTPPVPGAKARRSHSSDNLVVDYDLFTTSSKSDDEEAAARLAPHEGRVLVVSARDPRGRIIYMGASCRSDAGSKQGPRVSAAAAVAGSERAPGRRRRRVTASSASEALSVKKSAEIAAIFSDMKLAQGAMENNGSEVGVNQNCLEPQDFFLLGKSSTRSYLGSSLENSLGYLP